MGAVLCALWRWETGTFEWCEEEEGKGLPFIAEPTYRSARCEIAGIPPRVTELLLVGMRTISTPRFSRAENAYWSQSGSCFHVLSD